MSPFRLSRALFLPAIALLVVACSAATDEETDDSSDAVTSSLRWQLPANVTAIGARVRLTYDGPPKWSSRACSGGLKSGSKKLGEFLRDEFSQVDSIGGYACRRNTANASELSVHGTGRALDVFIPKTKSGAADNAKGDKVANWLVTRASKIGVQLVIWDRTIWRANGSNDSAYHGPHPHDDHIHVELTEEAAAMKMPWFANPVLGEDDSDSGMLDAGTSRDTGTSEEDPGGGSKGDPPPSSTKDASSPPPPPPPPPKDAGPAADPTPPDPADPEPDPGETEADAAAPSSTKPEDPASSWGESKDTGDDGPGERSSITPSEKSSSKKSASDESQVASSGCAATPSSTTSNASAWLVGLCALATFATRRRRR